MPFTVAIVGRPNVGKSTLFNRLVGKRLALVDDTPGVTRDRREGDARLGPLRFRAIDTAGLEDAAGETLSARMRRQTEMAAEAADLALFVVDGRTGVTPLDKHFADWLRRAKVPVRLVVNKCEGKAGEAGRLDAYSLGLGEPIAISAEHGEGLADLHDVLAEAMEFEQEEPESDAEADRPLHVAIVGRPNAGKSTLINRLIGEERLLTGPESGITRDSIALPWRYEGRPVMLFDTAGLRKKAKVVDKLEKLSVADALRAVQFADVVVVLIDCDRPMERQDAQIADLVYREGRGLVIAVNKWDMADNPKALMERVFDRLSIVLPQAKGVPVVTLSALTGQGIKKLMPAVLKIAELWNRRIPTAGLNRWLDEITQRHPPPAPQGRRLRLRYMTQIKTRPPTFVVFVSRPKDLPESYTRYLVNELRAAFNMPGVPIRLLLRRGKNPYVGDDG